MNIFHLTSPTAWALASAYASVCLLCLKVAASRSTSRIVQLLPAEVRRAESLWLGCAIALALLAVLAVWRLDLMLGEWLRQGLRNSGWYPMRRPLQGAVLLTSLWLIVLLLKKLLPSDTAWPLLGCAVGTALLLFVSWGRFLSWHWLDAVLDARWLGVSTGRWLEAGGLLAVAGCAAWQWRETATAATAGTI